MNKSLTIITFVLAAIIIYLYFFKIKSIETLIYFPADETAKFLNEETNISLIDHDTLQWKVESTSVEDVYLRQDVSLIYANGQFKGVINVWKQNTDHLLKSEQIQHDGNKFYDTISFHHGEIHRNENKITSIQKMSHHSLYVYKVANEKYGSFRKPTNKMEQKTFTDLNKINQENLSIYWQQLIRHFNIDRSEYISIPLTELIKYQELPIESLSEKQTSRVLGQLWEGLYKNYIVLVTDKKNHQVPHYMPLILIDKKATHIYVLFELNGEKIILKQLI